MTSIKKNRKKAVDLYIKSNNGHNRMIIIDYDNK